MWPNVINLVVIHTLFVYAGTWDHFEAWESHDENVTKTLFKIERSRTSWLIDECQLVRAQHIFAVLLPEIETLRGLLAKEDEFPLVPNSESGVDKFQSWRPRNTNWTLDFPPKLILILEWMLLSSSMVSLNFNWAFFFSVSVSICECCSLAGGFRIWKLTGWRGTTGTSHCVDSHI